MRLGRTGSDQVSGQVGEVLATRAALTILALNQGHQGWQDILNDLQER